MKSHIYLTEPPTNGKVVLHTSAGDIDVELFSKEAPLACRNFIQLCLEQQYDNSKVTSIIKDFMIRLTIKQTDHQYDFGTSIWGRPFNDEIHSRLKFSHRGIVAMSNENKPNSNHSQFFITTSTTPLTWLDRKHTIFGKVTGNTIYNVMRMNDLEVDNNETPVEPVHLTSIEVLVNPFDDIIPRDIRRSDAVSNEATVTVIDAKSIRKAVKDAKLLSFADDESNGVEDDNSRKFTKKNANMSNNSNMIKPDGARTTMKEVDETTVPTIQCPAVLESKYSHVSYLFENKNSKNEEIRAATMLKQLEQLKKENTDRVQTSQNNEYLEQRDQLLSSRRAIKVLTGQEALEAKTASSKSTVLSLTEQRRQQYLKRKKNFGDRESETLQKLSEFSSKLKKEKETSTQVEHVAESYHGQILEQDEKDGVDDLWHVGKLKCRKHVDDAYRNHNDDSILVIDPRLSKSTK